MQGRDEELHQRPGGAENPVDYGGVRGVAGEQIDHELGQHGNDNPEREHVEQHGDEEEYESRARRRDGRRCRFVRVIRVRCHPEPADQLIAAAVRRKAHNHQLWIQILTRKAALDG